jgi:predicted nucleic acid-binding protein
MIRIAYLIDTWVWIEHYEGRSQQAREFIEGNEILCVSAVTIAEIAQRYAKEGKPVVAARINDVLRRATVIPVDTTIATMAGTMRNQEIDGGIADAIILATARIGNHTIITGDQHFRDLPDVVFIGHTED